MNMKIKTDLPSDPPGHDPNMSDPQTPYKKAFAKIDPAKRLRILDTATKVFAEKGFVGANINIIAREAGVSIGAMYNYFDTKEDLFLTVVDHLHDFLEQGLVSTVNEEEGFYAAIETMVRAAVEGAVTHREKTNLYLNTTAEHIEGLSERLSRKMEGVTIRFYRSLAERAVASGELAPGTDITMLSFIIDNQIVALQRAYATRYHEARMKLFLDGETDPERVIPRVMKALRGAAVVS